MTVQELIDFLQKCPPEAPVKVSGYSNDGSLTVMNVIGISERQSISAPAVIINSPFSVKE